MSDTNLNKIIQYGTSTDRIAFTPDPAASSQVLYLWYETDNAPDTYAWDGSAWVQINPTSGGGGDFTQLAQVVTSSSQASVDFTSISGAYSSLKVVWMAQATAAGTSASTMWMKVNNDGTAGNYKGTWRQGVQNNAPFQSDEASSSAGGYAGYIPNAGNTNIAGAGEMLLASYAATTFHKRIIMSTYEDDGTTNSTHIYMHMRWANTAAIDRLTFSTAGTAFTDGSIFTLYGLT